MLTANESVGFLFSKASMFAFVFFFVAFLIPLSSASGSICPREHLLDALFPKTRCLLDHPQIAPLEVDGNSLDEALNIIINSDGYTSVLFYAKWCPHSVKARATFDVLSSMFPHISHFALEESSVLPSIFSRYGVHSVPAFLMVNQDSRVRYRGPKDIDVLVGFYKKITGIEPQVTEACIGSLNHPPSNPVAEEGAAKRWNRWLRGKFMQEYYLILSILFVCCRSFVYILPWVHRQLKAFYRMHGHRVNMGAVWGNRSRLLEQAGHILNGKRLWGRLRLCKMRKFHREARNARVWACL